MKKGKRKRDELKGRVTMSDRKDMERSKVERKRVRFIRMSGMIREK